MTEHRDATLSCLVPNASDLADPAAYVAALSDMLPDAVETVEIILVGGPGLQDSCAAISLPAPRFDLRVFEFDAAPAEDAGLRIALDRASGSRILTLTGWHSAPPPLTAELFNEIGASDMIVGARYTATDRSRAPFREKLFRVAIRVLFGQTHDDLFSRIRLGRRAAFEELSVMGMRQHFLPLVARWNGFRVTSHPVPETEVMTGTGPGLGALNIGGHYRAFVDMISLFVLLRFLDRPLRFFSALGLPLLAAGLIITASLAVARVVYDIGLSDRPLLTLGVLLIVVGIQIIAIGLIGDIIVYSGNRRGKASRVETVVRGEGPDPGNRHQKAGGDG